MTDIKPLVSIVCITYNHEKFIAETLDGFVMQKTSFPFEIIIHDDASTDNTAAIIKEYEAKYPNLFVSIYQTENQYQKKEKNIWGDITFPLVKGKYIAICEGDDYWLDPLKLQRQADFLESNPAYAMCFHEVYYKIDDEDLRLSEFNTNTANTTYTIEDLAKGNFIHTPSVFFRTGLFNQFPDWFKSAPFGDYVLHMLNAQHGLIKYMPEAMAVYRKHADGIWSSLKLEVAYEKCIKVVDLLLLEKFPEQVVANLQMQKNKYIEDILLLKRKEESLDMFSVKLKEYAENNVYINNKWLYEYYPAEIAKLTSQLSKYRNHWALKFIRKITRKQ